MHSRPRAQRLSAECASASCVVLVCMCVPPPAMSGDAVILVLWHFGVGRSTLSSSLCLITRVQVWCGELNNDGKIVHYNSDALDE